MARKRSKFKDELAEWRRTIQRALLRAEQPVRLDKDYTRGKYGVSYSPEPVFCPKHTREGKEGGKKITWGIYDPFCTACFEHRRCE